MADPEDFWATRRGPAWPTWGRCSRRAQLSLKESYQVGLQTIQLHLILKSVSPPPPPRSAIFKWDKVVCQPNCPFPTEGKQPHHNCLHLFLLVFQGLSLLPTSWTQARIGETPDPAKWSSNASSHATWEVQWFEGGTEPNCRMDGCYGAELMVEIEIGYIKKT